MKHDPLRFISGLTPFSSLPAAELQEIRGRISEQAFSRGDTLAIQGRTRIERIYIVKTGVLQLYYEQKGKKYLSGLILPGEIFGGISILMNSGISVRTVIAKEHSQLFCIEKQYFQDICNRFEFFHEHFVRVFSHRMLDKSYAAIVTNGQAMHFLGNTVPFSFLPKKEREKTAAEISIVQYPKDKVLFEQDRSRMEFLYMIQEGAAERYYIEGRQKLLRGVLGEGDIYGGISILLNNGISVRTLKTTENTSFYILGKKYFLDLCSKYDVFTEYFTDTFGKRMLDKSYAAIITKTSRPRIEAVGFLDQPVKNFFHRDLIACSADLSIRDAAAEMSRRKVSSIFVKTGAKDFVGVVTDNDLRKKVVASGYDIEQPVSHIMSSPLKTISGDALMFEALLSMMQENIKHLAVSEPEGQVSGIITNQDILTAQGHSPFFLIHEIFAAGTKEEIFNKHGQLPAIIQGLINNGAKSQNINKLITTVSDAILYKMIDFAIDELGPPPVAFVFMTLGSEGRKEQTLKTDQDNAILFEDGPATSENRTGEYFLRLGETVCNWLDKAGYAFCKGNVMAQNPQWCQSLKQWKGYFSSWIFKAAPEDLLQASIFFDFRGAYGNLQLVTELRNFLFDSLVGWAGFFRNLTENALHFKPPIGFFRNFVVESKGRHRNVFDVKSAMMPIVDFARIYALKHTVRETNTQERLAQLRQTNVISRQEYEELEQSYSFLMQLRFVRQITAIIDEGSKPDNYVNPRKLSRIEQTMLKEIFKRTEKFQAKLGFDFTGIN